MQSRIIEVPTGVKVKDLREFYEALKFIDASTIYNHVFEARQRDRQDRTDFSAWIEEVLNLKNLAQRIENIDSYMYTLEGLRNILLTLCRQELEIS